MGFQKELETLEFIVIKVALIVTSGVVYFKPILNLSSNFARLHSWYRQTSETETDDIIYIPAELYNPNRQKLFFDLLPHHHMRLHISDKFRWIAFITFNTEFRCSNNYNFNVINEIKNFSYCVDLGFNMNCFQSK